MTPAAFDAAVQLYCSLVGGSETSGRRTWLRNILVGGVSQSPHRYGLGKDVIRDDQLTTEEWALIQKRAPGTLRVTVRFSPEERREVATRLGLRLIVEDDHDHLQPLDWRAG